MSHSVLSARFWSTLAVVILLTDNPLLTGHAQLFAQLQTLPSAGPNRAFTS